MDVPVTHDQDSVADSVQNAEEQFVLDEVVEKESYGQFTGSTKWFNDKLGYGFITICDGDDKGKDIFVHHSGIKPLNSNYKTLRKGEYIQFNIINGMNGLQAVDVTGIKGGPLMCDYVTSKRTLGSPPPYQKNPSSDVDDTVHYNGWQTVARKPRVQLPPRVAPQKNDSVPKRQVKNTAKYNKNTRNQIQMN